MNYQTTRIVDEQAAYGFVVAQGLNIETAIYERRYPTLDYGNHVPVVTEGNPWALGTLFRLKDHTGAAKVISGKAADMPFGKTTRDQKTHGFVMVGAGWEYSDEETQQGVLYGIDIAQDDAMGAADDVERLLYDMAITGNDEVNWEGLANSSIVQRTDAAAVGGSTFWTAKDADEMTADINAGLEAVRSNSNEIEWADSVRLPPAAFRIIATRKLGTDDSGTTTVLDYIRKNNIYTAETNQPLDIRPLRDLKSASQDGGGRMVVYRRDPQVLRFHLPMPRRVLPVYRAALMHYQQGIIARTGGTEIRLPGAMAYIDEITAPPA